MPVLEEHHDFAHPVEPDTAWSESYYFNAYDPHTDTGFFTRIGVRHEARLRLGFDGRVGASAAVVEHEPLHQRLLDFEAALLDIGRRRVVGQKNLDRLCRDIVAIVT